MVVKFGFFDSGVGFMLQLVMLDFARYFAKREGCDMCIVLVVFRRIVQPRYLIGGPRSCTVYCFPYS